MRRFAGSIQRKKGRTWVRPSQYMLALMCCWAQVWRLWDQGHFKISQTRRSGPERLGAPECYVHCDRAGQALPLRCDFEKALVDRVWLKALILQLWSFTRNRTCRATAVRPLRPAARILEEPMTSNCTRAAANQTGSERLPENSFAVPFCNIRANDWQRKRFAVLGLGPQKK